MNLPAKKIEIIGLKEKYEEILEELQFSETVEVISVDPEKKVKERGFHQRKEKLELSLAQARFVRSFLNNFAKKENFLLDLINSFCPEKKKYRPEELQNLASSPTTQETVNKCQELETRLNEITAKKESLQRDIKDLEKFSGVNIPSSAKLQYFNIFTGSVPYGKEEEILNALQGKSIFFYIEWGERKKGKETGFCLVYPKEEKVLCDTAKEAGAKEDSVFFAKPPSELLEEKKKELLSLEEEGRERRKEGKDLSVEIPKFEALTDFCSLELEKLEVFENGKETENFFYLHAWAKPNKIKEVEKKVQKITPCFTINKIESQEDEKPPVFMENKGLLESFEVVTKVYGFPRNDEPDPTPFLTPFFAVAFGLALSDAGYGILLMALSFIMKKKMVDGRNFFNLFMISGFFTIIAGVLTGTFFGTDIFRGIKILDAMDDPIQVLFIVFILGVIQLFTGLLIGFFWNLKQGRKNIAFGPKLGSLLFFVGVASYFITGSIVFPIIFISLMVGLNIYFSNGESFIKKLAGGFGSLYDLIGYFSDVLSYSRLLALGLATGVIAMTINIIAQVSMEMIPVAGLNIAVAVFILVFGHIANLIINTLSSFIHSARLQFVEFFTKFMEGGGEEIKPLKKQGRFIKVVNS